ncbi:phage major capsid protein [Rubinisphaera sp.]|uniref:phage major capsid protein n=1 Tax=Rubinisphaera sp. TaxID=2024857 RepID=UPI000C100722|nr:phage major capsid protein [Rubinisphaera sp.]MBV07675.1 phage major capsid protein [Rubinisphaera sp.]
MNLRELLEEREKRFGKAKQLRNDVTKEKRELTDVESAEIDGLLNDVRTIDQLIDEKRSAEREGRSEQRNQSFTELEARTHAPAPIVRGVEPQNQDMRDETNNFERYSLLRAIQLRSQGLPLDGFEAEVSQEIATRTGRDPQGFFIPSDLPVDHRSREHRSFTATTGAGAIPTNLSSTLIGSLRNRMLLTQLGVTVIDGIVGELDIPKQTGNTTAYWLGEAGEPTESEPTIGQLELRAKTVGAYTDITRRLMNQTSLQAENFVRNDLVQTLSIESDRAALNGSGASNQPTGLLQTGSLPLVAIGTNGGALTYPHVVEMETKVAAANADMGNLAYVATAGGRGTMKVTERFTGTSGKTIWADDNTINGYQALATNQLPTNLTKGTGENLHPLIFGDWSAIVIGYWSGIDVMVDPYSKSKSGGVRVVVLLDMDVKIRHVESFAAIVDFDPAA